MISKVPPPDGRDAALAWLYAMSQVETVTANDAKLEAKRAEINAAIEDANAKVKAAEEKAAELIAAALRDAQTIDSTANDTAKRITAEAIADRNAAMAEFRSAQQRQAAIDDKNAELDDALARVRQDGDEMLARIASLKESQAEVEALRQRLSAAVKAAEAA